MISSAINCSRQYRSIAKMNFDYTEKIITSWNKHIPYIKPYYAVKSFPNKKFIDFLSNYKNSIGFDCASKYEIGLVKQVSSLSDIIYANPTKSIEDIQYASDNNVHTYVIDSIEEIKKINLIDKQAHYIIRVRSEELYSVMQLNRKFGAYRPDVFKMMDYIKEKKLRLKGFSYHVGSRCSNMKAHYNTLRMIDEQYLNYGDAKPYIIDIGGGFENEMQLSELHRELKKLNILEKFESKNIMLIAEPGRLFSQGAIEIYAKIISLRETYIDNVLTLFITINDSVYHSFQGKLFDHQIFNPIPLYVSEREEMVKCVIYGQTCDSIDIIVKDVMLPYPNLNDVFIFKNMGAYSFASAEGRFNGFNCAYLK